MNSHNVSAVPANVSWSKRQQGQRECVREELNAVSVTDVLHVRSQKFHPQTETAGTELHFTRTDVQGGPKK